jgi:hypothetical protein
MKQNADIRKPTTSLICMNMRGVWEGEEGAWTAAASLVLRHAREKRWRIAHVQCQGAPVDIGPLPGLEPTQSEPVISVSGLSAFESDAFRRWAEEGEGRRYVIGSIFSLAGAATVVGAQMLKMPLTLIHEACGEAADRQDRLTSQPRTEITVLTRSIKLADIVGRRSSAAVITLASHLKDASEAKDE